VVKPNSHINHPLIQQLINHVEENINNDQFGVEELSSAVNLSRSQLHRKLKKATGQSISQFIREYRLEKAKHLLLQENLTSSEVAYKVGFSSSTYFSKAFHDYFGYTPSETSKSKEYHKNPPLKKKDSSVLIKALIGLVLLISLVSFIFHLTSNTSNSSELDKNSIAVLPFKNLSAEEENQYFTDGMMEAILNKLTTISSINVTSSTSVEMYRDNTDKNIKEIARELNVKFLLEGSGQKYGNEIRITVQLINAANDSHTWSKEYTRKFKDVLQLQNEIAQNVANELETKLSIKDQEQLAKKPTDNLEAYEYYLQGNFQMNKFSKKGFQNAIPLLNKAIKLDSQFVEPYIRLGNIYAWGGAVWGIYSQQEAKEKSLKYLNKALEIYPDHPEALYIIASIYFYHLWDFDKALEFINRRRQIIGYHEGFAVDFFRKTGQLDTALNIEENDIRRDPLQSDNYAFKAEILFLKGKKKEAIETLNRVYPLYEDFFFLRECAKLYYLFGKIERSKDALEKLKRKYSDRSPIYFWLEAMYAFHDGDNPMPIVNRLKRMYEQDASGSPAWFTALCYAELDNEDKLFEWLEKSYQKREVEMTWLKMETILDPYKDDPRYKDLLKRIGFPKETWPI